MVKRYDPYNPLEHDEQAALIRWVEYACRQEYPILKMLYAIPNGGERNKAVAAKLKAEGVRPGVPDLHLPVARGGYHSLYVEMKRRRSGNLSMDQKKWRDGLRNEGNAVVVCRGWEEARSVLILYATGKMTCDQAGD